MKKKQKRKRAAEPSLADKLWGDTDYTETVKQENYKLQSMVYVLTAQRDDLVRTLNDRTNIGNFVPVMDATLRLLGDSITELQRMAKRLRSKSFELEQVMENNE